jgi:hypothetical protein
MAGHDKRNEKKREIMSNPARGKREDTAAAS